MEETIEKLREEKLVINTKHNNTQFSKTFFTCLKNPLQFMLSCALGAEDNLAQLEKILYPILNIENVLVTHRVSAKWHSAPSRGLFP